MAILKNTKRELSVQSHSRKIRGRVLFVVISSCVIAGVMALFGLW